MTRAPASRCTGCSRRNWGGVLRTLRFPRRATSLGIAACLTLVPAIIGRASDATSGRSGQTTSALPELLKVGRDAVLTGRPNEALSIFKQALTLAETTGDERSLAQALEGYGWGEWATGRY